MYDFVLVFANSLGTNEPRPISIGRISSKGIWVLLGKCDLGAYMDIEYPIESEEITHWMPFPKLPDIQNDDQNDRFFTTKRNIHDR